MIDPKNSQSVRAGSITYFFDVKETKQGKPYLMITMSRFRGEGEDWDRVSIPLFPEHVQKFTKTFLEMVQNLPTSNDDQNTTRPQSTASQIPSHRARAQRSAAPAAKRHSK